MSRPDKPQTLIVLRSASGRVVHGPFVDVKHAAWVELESSGVHVEFQVLDDKGRVQR